MDQQSQKSKRAYPRGHLPTLVAALALWWLILQVLPIDFLLTLMGG